MNVGGALEPRPFSYSEALAWLYGLQRFGIKLGLENIQRLLAILGLGSARASRANASPARTFGASPKTPFHRVIHVAGTNGKGSVCAMIDSMLHAQGIRTGLFTSPHLVTFRERIRVNGQLISEEAVASGLTTIRDLVCVWDPHPTFFEIATALAVKHFADANVQVAILETGLGGRLDATNALPSDVAAITPVALDHQKWLGDTLTKIASEKAGIIKAKIPVVCAPQHPDAEQVIRARATECEAPLQFVTGQYEGSPIALRGAYQKQNAVLAIAALRAAKIDIDEKAIARGLSRVDWPARFQLWNDRIIIDGAHNPAAAKILAQTWREIFGDARATLVLAVLADKDMRGICKPLAQISDEILLPKIRSVRAADPAELAKVLSSITPSLPNASPARTSITLSIPEALSLAYGQRTRILITGSLHFAGEVLAYLQGKPAAFEECAQ